MPRGDGGPGQLAEGQIRGFPENQFEHDIVFGHGSAKAGARRHTAEELIAPRPFYASSSRGRGAVTSKVQPTPGNSLKNTGRPLNHANRVARQHCPSPLHRHSQINMPFSEAKAKGGHFYFAGKGTFLFCLDT
ncbi:hypothetical protein SBA4_940011 [Candidatus Sulfopaludibacter sp. SbA4]|nr:hypothetical protein SBA4_940011 [Candidatus Sulfopaludibacter sp. SbA4]